MKPAATTFQGNYVLGTKTLIFLKAGIMDFWRRHKRKIFVTLGVLGGGYIMYKLYSAHKHQFLELEKQLVKRQENDESIKAQMQQHFETIQRIADTTTLPHAMHYLSSRVAEELDLSTLTERLQQGKDHPTTLTSVEKLELWDGLKVLSFTRMVLSLWAMTILSLYIRVQVNILGRHLYIDIARGFDGSHLLEDANPINHEDEQNFLGSSDFLASSGLPTLINDMQAAATESLRSKQLRDAFDTTMLQETIIQILNIFMSMGRPYHWVEYLIPDDSRLNYPTSSSGSASVVSRFEQLVAETRVVLSSAEFRHVVDVSLKTLADAVVTHISNEPGGGKLSSGMPLAKLLPRVAQVGPLLLDKPAENRFIKIITSIQDVELFFTLLYANIPTSQTREENLVSRPPTNTEPPTPLVEASKGLETLGASGAIEAGGLSRLVDESNLVREDTLIIERALTEDRIAGPSVELTLAPKEPLVCPVGLDIGVEAIGLEEYGPKAFMPAAMASSFPSSARGDQSERESTPSLGLIASSSHQSPSNQRQ
ncbi:hypothetical protein Nepgr_016801 [Nepenthes gracilis]|uniref:Peroxin-3 n=1 Tax=Nepenthes gracilis TaxID=150966 RepID=A0AAD3SN97_NEPGR|nr:hypothetical protein Nepgr_016801 [Nepenthes gracilis]